MFSLIETYKKKTKVFLNISNNLDYNLPYSPAVLY